MPERLKRKKKEQVQQGERSLGARGAAGDGRFTVVSSSQQLPDSGESGVRFSPTKEERKIERKSDVQTLATTI